MRCRIEVWEGIDGYWTVCRGHAPLPAVEINHPLAPVWWEPIANPKWGRIVQLGANLCPCDW